MLENRRLLTVSVVQTGSTLKVVGESLGQIVRIQDSYTAGTHQTHVWVDANGNGAFTNRGDLNDAIYRDITTFDISLGGGNDSLTISLPDGYDGATKTFNVHMGAGADTVSFANVTGNPIHGSSVVLKIDTSLGADKVKLALADVSSSTVAASITTGIGNDVVSVGGGGRLGNSIVSIAANLGDGNDRFTNSLDWEDFDVLGSSSAWRMSVSGGAGNDTLSVGGYLGDVASRVQGLLDLELYGQGGSDTLSANLDQFLLQGGTLRLREDGGDGVDHVALSGGVNESLASGTVDAILQGGSGNDVLSSSVDVSALNQYASTAGILIDGGAGTDAAAISGNAVVTKRNIEL
jgi:hypothetical protein